ncbi:MAG: SMC-Scp complex subunit ScpB [Treponema sp.]|jgi:segregation and condensation protein B|nr:SMC-Scp complex subunit ScpB [Treponema sp.]
MSSTEKETAIVEAILYLESCPIDEGAISRISGLSNETVISALENIKNRYAETDCGLELSNIGGGIMISVKREYWETLKERYGRKGEGKISRAAMETLSIVAYMQPVTRPEIEKIRGVSADNMIRLLLEKNLVREAGKKDIPGRPVMYGTTKEFLKIFGLSSIAELPKLGESDIEKFELEGEKY